MLSIEPRGFATTQPVVAVIGSRHDDPAVLDRLHEKWWRDPLVSRPDSGPHWSKWAIDSSDAFRFVTLQAALAMKQTLITRMPADEATIFIRAVNVAPPDQSASSDTCLNLSVPRTRTRAHPTKECDRQVWLSGDAQSGLSLDCGPSPG
jgi:hypothetical protein